ncbi:MAG: hypothetical protein LUE31_06630 [Lachnospiraceae bacterium]|nr:hypothetical protein [Lachnospiraceae bacterium]
MCYDDYGLPYLPAKRLKGCLREAAQELRDWGVDIPIEELFGAKRNRPAGFTLSDGRLEDYAQSVAAIRQEKDRSLVHPQKVLAEYSYTRMQTRIDGESGTALEDTLRITRVLKKVWSSSRTWSCKRRNIETALHSAAVRCAVWG